MAEELDIRSIWNSSKEKEDPKSLQINLMERKGTKSTLQWVKIILWVEFWLTIVGAPLGIYFAGHLYSQAELIVYGAICFGYLFYYQFLIREINRFSYDRNVVQNLKKVYGYLRFYLLHYKVVIWLSILVGILMEVLKPENRTELSEISTTAEWIKFLSIMIVMFAILGGIMTFLVHLIYGRKIKRLRGMVKELEHEE